MGKYVQLISKIWWFSLSVIFLLLPALQNGYPLLHPDSGTYIYVGFLDYVPVSRPITYCWLVRHISLYYSLWLVVIFQSILVITFLNLLVYKLVGSKTSSFYTFILISILTAFSSLPVFVCHIMPDIYLSIAFIALFITLTANKIQWYWQILLSCIIIYSTIVHYSNIPILTGFLIAGVALYFLFRRKNFIRIYPKRLLVVAVIVIISWVSIPSINASYGNGYVYSRVSNIVYTARLIPSGIFADYVAEKCETDTTFFLYEFRNSIPKYIFYDSFLWNDTSFLYKQDCENTSFFADCWLRRDSIYGVVVDDIMSIPKYRSRFIRDAAEQFGNQLVTFHLLKNTPFGETSHINFPIKTYFKVDYAQYLNATQQRCVITYEFRNYAQDILIVLSLLVILVFFSLKKLRKFISTDYLTFFVFYVILILANAGLIGLVSIVTGRFEGRIIFIIPVLAFILLARYSLSKPRSETN